MEVGTQKIPFNQILVNLYFLLVLFVVVIVVVIAGFLVDLRSYPICPSRNLVAIVNGIDDEFELELIHSLIVPLPLPLIV